MNLIKTKSHCSILGEAAKAVVLCPCARICVHDQCDESVARQNEIPLQVLLRENTILINLEKL